MKLKDTHYFLPPFCNLIIHLMYMALQMNRKSFFCLMRLMIMRLISDMINDEFLFIYLFKEYARINGCGFSSYSK